MTTNSHKSPCQKCLGHRNESRGVKNQLIPCRSDKGVKLNSHRSALYLLTGVIKIASKSFMRSRNSIYTGWTEFVRDYVIHCTSTCIYFFFVLMTIKHFRKTSWYWLKHSEKPNWSYVFEHIHLLVSICLKYAHVRIQNTAYFELIFYNDTL